MRYILSESRVPVLALLVFRERGGCGKSIYIKVDYFVWQAEFECHGILRKGYVLNIPAL